MWYYKIYQIRSYFMFVLSAVNAHEVLALIEFALKQGHRCLQFLAAFPQAIAICLGLLCAIFVMLLGQFESLLKLIDLCTELQLEHPQLRLSKLILEIISITS